MSNDPWVVALKDKSLPELEEAYNAYKKQLTSYQQIKEKQELTGDDNRDFLTKSYRSAMIWNEMRERA